MKIFQTDQPFFQKPILKSRPIERILLICFVLVHLVIVFSVVRSANPLIWPLHNDTIHRSGRASDFYAIYHAAVNLEAGISPYEINDDGITPYYYQFRYFPVVAEAGRIFTLTTPYRAYVLWVLFLEGLLALLLYYFWTRMDRAVYRMITVGLLLINSPYFLELYMGQFTFATIALCFLSLVLPAGFLFYSASVILKPITLAAIPALIRKKSTLITALVAGVIVILTNLPMFLANPETWQTFYSLNFASTGGGLHSGNYGLVYLLWQLANDLSLTSLLAHWEAAIGALRLLVLALVALLVVLSKATNRAGVSALLLAHFVTYQHVWEHHYSAVCIIAAVMMTIPAMRKQYGQILLCMLVLALPTPFGLFDIAKDPAVFDPTLTWPRIQVYLVILPKALPALYLFILAIRRVLQAGLVTPMQVFKNLQSDSLEN